MKTTIIRAILAISTCALVSCTSTKEIVKHYLQENKPDEALTLIDRHVEKSPDDLEAQAIQRSARLKWMEKSLIDIRLFRLGGNLNKSEQLLKDVLLKQNNWQVYPTGAAYSTQREEIDFLSKRIKEQFLNAITNNKPLQAQWLYHQNGSLLRDTLKTNTQDMNVSAQNLGRKFCLEEISRIKSTDHYTYKFIHDTCRIWTMKVPHKDTRNSVALYSAPKVRLEISQLSEPLQRKFVPSFEKAFSQSFWHDSKSTKILEMNMKGNFRSAASSSDVSLVADYFVSVPYTETFRRSKREPATSNIGAFFEVLSALSAPRESVRDNGDGTETVTVTKYKQEQRTYPYNAKRFQQDLNIAWNIESKLNGQKLAFDFEDNYSKISFEHNENFPSAGLTPSSPQIITEEKYIEMMGEKLILDMRRKLSESWHQQFCKDQDLKAIKSAALSSAEQVFRCLHGSPDNIPGFAETWMIEKFGVTHDQWKILAKGDPF